MPWRTVLALSRSFPCSGACSAKGGAHGETCLKGAWPHLGNENGAVHERDGPEGSDESAWRAYSVTMTSRSL